MVLRIDAGRTNRLHGRRPSSGRARSCVMIRGRREWICRSIRRYAFRVCVQVLHDHRDDGHLRRRARTNGATTAGFDLTSDNGGLRFIIAIARLRDALTLRRQTLNIVWSHSLLARALKAAAARFATRARTTTAPCSFRACLVTKNASNHDTKRSPSATNRNPREISWKSRQRQRQTSAGALTCKGNPQRNFKDTKQTMHMTPTKAGKLQNGDITTLHAHNSSMHKKLEQTSSASSALIGSAKHTSVRATNEKLAFASLMVSRWQDTDVRSPNSTLRPATTLVSSLGYGQQSQDPECKNVQNVKSAG